MENKTILHIIKQVDIADKEVYTLIKKADFYLIIVLFSLCFFIVGILLGKVL